MFYKDPYLEFVHQEALKIGKYFLLDSGEGREFIDSETGWRVEDLSGYLVDPADYQNFLNMKQKGTVDDYFLKDYIFAIWEKNSNASLKINFKKYEFTEKIIIDFEPCKSIDDVHSLLKKDLNLADWDDKNPDALLRQLKELPHCKIYLRGTNLVSKEISEYVKQIANIFNKVEDMYNNIRVYTWKAVTIDFTETKSVYEAHKLISETLDFPDWYGGNLDALWDLLTGYIPPYEIHIKGINDAPEYLRPALKKIAETFKKAETKYDYHKIITEV